MNHKAGDTVRIRSKEWIYAQEKLVGGSIEAGRLPFIPEMWKLAGRIARVTEAESNCYKIDLDAGFHNWTEEMFDSDYDPLAPLSAEDAIRAMLDGETLYDEDGRRAIFNAEEGWFEYEGAEGDGLIGEVFKGLSRRLPKRTRPMTRWEILAWANSDESRGWVSKTADDKRWYPPQFYGYTGDLTRSRRARLLPDHSGIDEDTIQGFEVEE